MFAIGVDGAIVNNFDTEVPGGLFNINPTLLIQHVSYAAILLYMELRRPVFNDNLIFKMKKDCANLIELVTALFDYKQIVINSNNPLSTTKLHMISHYPQWIEEFGPPIGYDTERWENYLKYCGKKIWRGCRKRKVDITKHLTNKVNNDCIILLFNS